MAAVAHGFVEQNTQQSHTGDTNYWTALTASGSSFVAGAKYLIIACAQFGGSNYASEVGARLVHGSVATEFLGAEFRVLPASGTASYRYDFAYMTVWTQPGTVEDIKFQIVTYDSAEEVYADSIIIWWMRLDADLVDGTDYKFTELDNSSTLPELGTDWAGYGNVAFTPTSGEDWLILANPTWKATDDASSHSACFAIYDGANRTAINVHCPTTVNAVYHPLLARVFANLSGAQTFTCQGMEDDAAANIKHHSTRIFALRLNKFKDHFQFWNEAEVAVDELGWAEVGNIDFTPTATADFLLLAAAIFDANSTNRAGRMSIALSDTYYPTGHDANGDFTCNYYLTGEESFFTIAQRNLEASSQNLDVDGRASSTGGYIEDRQVLALSMELAASNIKEGQATLSGSGTASASATRIRAVIATVSGSGTASATGTVNDAVEGQAALSGSGTTAVIGRSLRTGVAALSGSGSVICDVTPQTIDIGDMFGGGAAGIVEGQAALAGAGAAAVIGRAIRQALSTLSASGTASAIGYLNTVEGQAALTGLGSLVAVVFNAMVDVDLPVSTGIVHEGQVSLSGGGSTAIKGCAVWRGATTLSGSGTTSASTPGITEGQATLSGSGTVAAQAEPISIAQLALSGQGALAVTGFVIHTGAVLALPDVRVLPVIPRPRVYVHDAFPPYKRVVELTTATEVKRGWRIMEAVPGGFLVQRTDPAFSLFSMAEVLRTGNMIVVECYGLPVWVGFIDIPDWSLRSRAIKVTVKDAIKVLDEREIRPLEAVCAAGSAFFELVSTANRRNPTGIVAEVAPDPGPMVNVDFGSGSVLSALTELSEVSGQEWYLDISARPQGVTMTLRWSTSIGQDRSRALMFREGDPRVIDASYRQTSAGIVASAAVIGAPAGGGGFSSRNVARVTLLPPSTETHGTFTPASAAQQKRLGSWLTPATSREVALVRNAIADVATLTQRASSSIDRSCRPEEIELLLALSGEPLMGVGVGDIVGIEAQNLGPTGIRKSFRIVEIDPDDASGQVTIRGPVDGGLGLRRDVVRRILGLQSAVEDLQLK